MVVRTGMAGLPLGPSLPAAAHGYRFGPLCRRWAERLLKDLDQLDDPVVGERIKNRLAIAPRHDQTILSQQREMLGRNALPHAEHLGEFADRGFPLHDGAQDSKP